jgi:hypothetical protein
VNDILLLLILMILADIARRLRGMKPLAPAGGGILQPWQAWELLNTQAKLGNVGRWQ